MTGLESWPFGRLLFEKASKSAIRIAAADFSGYSDDPVLVRELKRYFLVRKIAGRPLTMQSRRVDEVWHAFILDTRRYSDFCREVFGGYLHHRSSELPVDPSFEALYRELFGQALDPVWDEDRQASMGPRCGDCA